MATAAGTAAIFNTFSRASRLSISRRRFNCTRRRISRNRARNLISCCSGDKTAALWHVPRSVTPASFSQRLRVPSLPRSFARYLSSASFWMFEPAERTRRQAPPRRFIREPVPDRLSAAFTMSRHYCRRNDHLPSEQILCLHPKQVCHEVRIGDQDKIDRFYRRLQMRLWRRSALLCHRLFLHLCRAIGKRGFHVSADPRGKEIGFICGLNSFKISAGCGLRRTLSASNGPMLR